MNNIDILEELSNNEHIRWSNWQKYVHSKCIKNDDGSLTIPKEYVEHWEYEINTEYANLPEKIKESDRREVRQILEKLNYSTLIAENKELKEKNKELKVINKMQEYRISVIDERELISKSKVEEKIQELEKDIEIYSNYEEDWAKIKVLQSLLGKE